MCNYPDPIPVSSPVPNAHTQTQPHCCRDLFQQRPPRADSHANPLYPNSQSYHQLSSQPTDSLIHRRHQQSQTTSAAGPLSVPLQKRAQTQTTPPIGETTATQSNTNIAINTTTGTLPTSPILHLRSPALQQYSNRPTSLYQYF